MKKLKKLKGPGKQKRTTEKKKSKFVFFIGDEGGILSYIQGNTVVRRLYATSANPENTLAFKELIQSDPKASIYLLVDMIDQSYVKQSLPPVTKLSVQKLIKRRLERDFAPEDITGALPLGREKEGRRDWNYLLISLASSPQLIEWIGFILEFDNIFRGIHLVPVEAEQFIQKLANHQFGKEKSLWQFLVCHNKVGGFRQVIVKDNRLTFTRLAQPIGDISPEVIAGNVEQEVGNTIEYLKRLSYRESDGLDILIIVSADIKAAIDNTKLKANNVAIMTPHEVAEVLRLNQAAMPEDHYADVVFSASFGTHKKPVLTLHTGQSKKLLNLYQVRFATLVGATLITLALVGFSASNVSNIIPLYSKINELEEQKAKTERTLAETRDKAKLLPADLDRITDVVSIYETFSDRKYLPLNFIHTLGSILQNNVNVRMLYWHTSNALEKRMKKEDAPITIEVEVEFLNNVGPVEQFKKEAQSFFDLIETSFPEYHFSHSPLPGVTDKPATFQTSFDGGAEQNTVDMLSGEHIYVTLSFTTAEPGSQQESRRGR